MLLHQLFERLGGSWVLDFRVHSVVFAQKFKERDGFLKSGLVLLNQQKARDLLPLPLKLLFNPPFDRMPLHVQGIHAQHSDDTFIHWFIFYQVTNLKHRKNFHFLY